MRNVLFRLLSASQKRACLSSLMAVKGVNEAEWFRPLDLTSGVPWVHFSILLVYGFVLSSPEWDSPTKKKKYCKSIFHECFETLRVVHKNLSFILFVFLFQVRRLITLMITISVNLYNQPISATIARNPHF